METNCRLDSQIPRENLGFKNCFKRCQWNSSQYDINGRGLSSNRTYKRNAWMI